MSLDSFHLLVQCNLCYSCKPGSRSVLSQLCEHTPHCILLCHLGISTVQIYALHLTYPRQGDFTHKAFAVVTMCMGFLLP